MQLHQLPSITKKSQKRFGRGYGSGKGGHTATRGQKGQKSRYKIKIWFEGGQLPLTKRTPFLKGKGRFKSLSSKTIPVNTGELNHLKSGSTVTKDILVKHGLIKLSEASRGSIKILAKGELKIPLNIDSISTSKKAANIIIKAGGKILPPKLSSKPDSKTSKKAQSAKKDK